MCVLKSTFGGRAISSAGVDFEIQIEFIKMIRPQCERAYKTVIPITRTTITISTARCEYGSEK